MSAEQDAVWARVNAELIHRRNAGQMPDGWAALGRALGMSVQVTTNWRTRGVPPRAHRALAAALGWSVDQLLGIEPPPAPVPVGHDAEFCALLAVMARHITTADEATREAIAPLLRRLASDPSRIGPVTRMLEALLTANCERQKADASGRRLREIGPPPGVPDRRHH